MHQTPDSPASTGRRIGVYGGTFDPPHLGHLIIASETRITLELDEIVFVPAGQPPHKDPARVTPAAARLEMLRLAIADNPNFRIDTLEIERDGRSWTAETLMELTSREPDADHWFLMGADSLAALHTWRQPDQILALARIAVAARPGTTIQLDDVHSRVPATRGRVDLVDVPLIDIASHTLRHRARQGIPLDYLVPDSVSRHIARTGIYASPQVR
ncbi:MAG TPA: nicotinate-nucleotide adenylyltransferase [Thermomicrobiales bacterium]|nr:nicotinate-nucleotide adenylyltransferase [Thermomicrobiales bacterium]